MIKDKQKKKNKYLAMTFSFLGAVLFWAFNALNQEGYTTQINYPLHIKIDSTKELEILKPAPSIVSLEIKGRGWNILRKYLRIGESPIAYTVDNPTEIKQISGDELLLLCQRTLKDISVVKVLNDSLTMDYQLIVESVLPIKVSERFIDSKSDFIPKGRIKLDHDQVKVRGAQSIVYSLERPLLITPHIDLVREGTQKLQVDISELLPENIVCEPKVVNLEFEVVAMEAEANE